MTDIIYEDDKYRIIVLQDLFGISLISITVK